jgi:antitoxin component YwqK of YwqJK toxin-antitoxin module
MTQRKFRADETVLKLDFWDSGQIMLQTSYLGLGGKLEGESKCWHENGQLHMQNTFRNGKLNGDRKFWYENGQLQLQEFYQDGKLNGKYSAWYDTGRINMLAFYRDEKFNGEVRVWNKDGKIRSCIYYLEKGFEHHFTGKMKNSILKLKNAYKKHHNSNFSIFLISDLEKIMRAF